MSGVNPCSQAWENPLGIVWSFGNPPRLKEPVATRFFFPKRAFVTPRLTGEIHRPPPKGFPVNPEIPGPMAFPQVREKEGGKLEAQMVPSGNKRKPDPTFPQALNRPCRVPSLPLGFPGLPSCPLRIFPRLALANSGTSKCLNPGEKGPQGMVQSR